MSFTTGCEHQANRFECSLCKPWSDKSCIEIRCTALQSELAALKAENAKYREALEFYASCPEGKGMIEGQINGGEWIPLGTKAREALEVRDSKESKK